MSENSDALKRGYDAFNSGDIDAVGEIFADDKATRVQSLAHTAEVKKALGG